MAIKVKFFTVVTRIETIEKKYPEGLDAYMLENRIRAPYRDQHIAGVIFMSMQDVEYFIAKLVNFGFSDVVNGEADEIAVLDIFHGPLLPCSWLETRTLTLLVGQRKRIHVLAQRKQRPQREPSELPGKKANK